MTYLRSIRVGIGVPWVDKCWKVGSVYTVTEGLSRHFRVGNRPQSGGRDISWTVKGGF